MGDYTTYTLFSAKRPKKGEMMVEPFDADGFLQPGLHHYTYSGYVKQFVQDFPDSRTREEIHTLSFLWLAELKRHMTPLEVWINGEFISAQDDPKSIELCVFLDKAQLDDTLAEKGLELQQRASQYRCRAYFGFNHDSQDPFDAINGPYYWTEQFGFNPEHVPKGIIVLPWDEILIALT